MTEKWEGPAEQRANQEGVSCFQKKGGGAFSTEREASPKARLAHRGKRDLQKKKSSKTMQTKTQGQTQWQQGIGEETKKTDDWQSTGDEDHEESNVKKNMGVYGPRMLSLMNLNARPSDNSFVAHAAPPYVPNPHVKEDVFCCQSPSLSSAFPIG